MKRFRTSPICVGLVAVAAFLLAGCGGGPSKEALAQERMSYVIPLQETVLTTHDLGAAKRAAAGRELKCRRRIGGFVSARQDSIGGT